MGIKPSYDPAIPLLGICPEETKTEKDTYTPMFFAALFTRARTWKQHRYPLTAEWIKETVVKVKVTQLCLTLCDPIDYTVHGIP